MSRINRATYKGKPLCSRRDVETAFDFEDTVFERRKTAAERALVAFEFGHALVVALRVSVKCLQKLCLRIVDSFNDVVIAVAHFRAKLFDVLPRFRASLSEVGLQLGPEVRDVAFTGRSVSVVHEFSLIK